MREGQEEEFNAMNTKFGIVICERLKWLGLEFITCKCSVYKVGVALC